MSLSKKLLWLLPVALILVVVGFVAWASAAAGAMPEAIAALVSDGVVRVDTERWISFTPTGDGPDTGFIFYPGGRVDPRAYAPALRDLAAEGYLGVIVPMPLNLAVFAPTRAAEVITAFPEITHWVVGGHSLGGAMAAAFVYGNPGLVDGLALWAAYPAGSNDLSGREGLLVTSIYGARDGLADVAAIDSSRSLLPVTARFVEIAGGNHAQFGWYGSQAGDNEATISRERQQEMVVDAMVDLLALVSAAD